LFSIAFIGEPWPTNSTGILSKVALQKGNQRTTHC
jgi:hypothetical protein